MLVDDVISVLWDIGHLLWHCSNQFTTCSRVLQAYVAMAKLFCSIACLPLVHMLQRVLFNASGFCICPFIRPVCNKTVTCTGSINSIASHGPVISVVLHAILTFAHTGEVEGCLQEARKVHRFGHWLTLCTLNIDLLYLLYCRNILTTTLCCSYDATRSLHGLGRSESGWKFC